LRGGGEFAIRMISVWRCSEKLQKSRWCFQAIEFIVLKADEFILFGAVSARYRSFFLAAKILAQVPPARVFVSLKVESSQCPDIVAINRSLGNIKHINRINLAKK